MFRDTTERQNNGIGTYSMQQYAVVIRSSLHKKVFTDDLCHNKTVLLNFQLQVSVIKPW